MKLYEDETNLRAHLLLDTSASMRFASRKGAMSKLEYGRTLAAALAWILIRQRDAAGLALFDADVSLMLPPRSANRQRRRSLTALDAIEGGGETRCGRAIDAVASRISRRGLCVVLSDLFDDPEAIIHGLRHLRFKQQDVMVLRVLDPDELDFFRTGSYKLRDLETGAAVSLDGAIADRFFQGGVRPPPQPPRTCGRGAGYRPHAHHHRGPVPEGALPRYSRRGDGCSDAGPRVLPS